MLYYFILHHKGGIKNAFTRKMSMLDRFKMNENRNYDNSSIRIVPFFVVSIQFPFHSKLKSLSIGIHFIFHFQCFCHKSRITTKKLVNNTIVLTYLSQ